MTRVFISEDSGAAFTIGANSSGSLDSDAAKAHANYVDKIIKSRNVFFVLLSQMECGAPQRRCKTCHLLADGL